MPAGLRAVSAPPVGAGAGRAAVRRLAARVTGEVEELRLIDWCESTPADMSAVGTAHFSALQTRQSLVASLQRGQAAAVPAGGGARRQVVVRVSDDKLGISV